MRVFRLVGEPTTLNCLRSPFVSVLIQFIDNLLFHRNCSVTSCVPSFLLLRFDGITRLVIYRRAVFPQE